MIPFAGIALLAALSAELPRAILRGDVIEVVLPANVFRNEKLMKHLASGLTTTIAVSGETTGSEVRIEIRYDLWDEVYRIACRDALGKQEQLTLPSTPKLVDWLSGTPFRVASGTVRVPPAFPITMKVIPFSATEQEDAQRWLLHSMHASEGTQPATPPTQSSTPGAFDRMIAASVHPEAILTWHWKVAVTRP